MNKKVVIVGCLVVVVVAGGGFAYWKINSAKATTNKIESDNQPEVVQEPSNETQVAKRPGVYEAYSAAKLTQAVDGKVILFFNASWSKTSKEIDKNLKNNVSKIPNNFTILSVDYNKSADLKKKYDVPFENTFVQVDANGVMINRWSGSESLEEIVALSK